MSDTKTFLFDFDSTVVGIETLDCVLEQSLKEKPAAERTLIMDQIRHITMEGMAGRIDLHDSIERRLSLGRVHRSHIESVAQLAAQHITQGLPEVLQLICDRGHQVGIVSGAIIECIVPTVQKLGIPFDWIFANRAKFDSDSFVLGVEDLPLAYSDGKAKVIRELKANGRIAGQVILTGDGASDLVAYQPGCADQFIGFGIHVVRETVERQSPLFFRDMPSYAAYIQSQLG